MSAPHPGSSARTAGLTAIAMLAFAANSVLCRLALQRGEADAGSFTVVRLLAGALVLALLLALRGQGAAATAILAARPGASWISALSLFGYATAFSFAYVRLQTGVGALILFGTVQLTMVGWGWWRGERLTRQQWMGGGLAVAGLVGLILPALAPPDPLGGALMGIAGACWGSYSLRGRAARDPLAATAGNFLRTVPLVLALGGALALGLGGPLHLSRVGLALALASGALASALGYVLWYAALRHLLASQAATVQLSVPVLAAAAGVILLGEPLTLRLVGAALTILGGIGIAQHVRRA